MGLAFQIPGCGLFFSRENGKIIFNKWSHGIPLLSVVATPMAVDIVELFFKFAVHLSTKWFTWAVWNIFSAAWGFGKNCFFWMWVSVVYFGIRLRVAEECGVFTFIIIFIRTNEIWFRDILFLLLCFFSIVNLLVSISKYISKAIWMEEKSEGVMTWFC